MNGDSEPMASAPIWKNWRVAAFLRALAPEHGSDVIEFLDAGALIEPVLDIGADYRRRGFQGAE